MSLKKLITVMTVLFLLSLPVLNAQEAAEEKKEDPLKNFSIVEETQPVPENLKVGFESITAKDAVTYLKFISSDLLQGRDTATPGYEIAAEYVASMFELWGIKPAGAMTRPRMASPFAAPAAPQKTGRSYFQTIPLRETIETDSKAIIEWQKGAQKKSRAFVANQDYSYGRMFGGGTSSFTAPVVFVGYGIQEKSLNLDDYKNLDVKGKIVMMLSETPGKDDPESPFNKGEMKAKYYPQRQMMRRMTSPKSALAKKLGAVAILQVENSPQTNGDVAQRVVSSRRINDERPIFPGTRRRLSLIQGKTQAMPWDTIPTIRISREMADAILGYVDQDTESLKGKIETTLKSHSMVLSGVSFTLATKAKTKLVSSRNVLGYIEGTDPELKNELIVIGAHLDHLGQRGDYIFNGADDNGSGSAAVMEVAQAFAKNPLKPKRSVVFALWTGEEKGLLGSYYYVANPTMADKKIANNINLDMVSRTYTKERLQRMGRMMGELPEGFIDKIDIKKLTRGSYDANVPEFGEMLKANNQYVGLHLQLNPSKEPSGGSDHFPFAMAKIPYVYFMAAMTEDYHQPSDSVEKTSPELMEKIFRLTYLMANSIANK